MSLKYKILDEDDIVNAKFLLISKIHEKSPVTRPRRVRAESKGQPLIQTYGQPAAMVAQNFFIFKFVW